MQLYIIRHAQSVNNALWAETGNGNGRLPDPPITDLGRQQAIHLGQHLLSAQADLPTFDANPHQLTRYQFNHLYSSLMLRAVQTGHILAEALDLPLLAWEIIHEWGGIYEQDEASGETRGLPGPNRHFFAEQFNRLVLPETLGEVGWWNRPFEPPENSAGRAASFLQELLVRHGGTDDRVAIVTHGGFYQALMRTLLGSQGSNGLFSQPAEIWFRINNTAVTRIDFGNSSIDIAYQNQLHHLPAALIS